MPAAVTVAICTYNRIDLLPAALNAILAQQVPDGAEWELVVVDNNSTDGTSAFLAEFASRHPRIRALREPRQGISYARNLCLEQAQYDLIAFTDDDIQPAPDWLANILRTADERPDLAIFCGKVLPAPGTPFPSWLTAVHHAPLALLDRGDRQVALGHNVGLVGANMIIDRRQMRGLAPFDPTLGRVIDTIGSQEDDDMTRRILEAGGKGAYIPDIVVSTEIQPDRLRRRYHWRWHHGHGHFTALRRLPEYEQSNRYILGIPGHIVRAMLMALLLLPFHLTNGTALMEDLNRLCWTAGFLREFRRRRQALP